MDFIKLVNAYGRTMAKNEPPIIVAHPKYGQIGKCEAQKGFRPGKGRWASVNAILRDASKFEVKMLRRLEEIAPKFAVASIAAILSKNPFMMPYVMGAISTYDGIVAARGGGNYQDIWMTLTATIGGVTTSWYDTFKGSWTPGSTPSVTAYTHGGTGGAVMDAASNGSWLVNPNGSNEKYIVSCGLTTPNITGFAMAMLYDCLWAGGYSLTSNTTIDPTTDVAVTRYAGAAANGNRIMTTMTSTLTHTGAATVTITYVNEGGTSGKTTIFILPATGVAVNRVIGNTLHSSATVVTCTPFAPLTNGGDAGVRSLESIQIAGGTVSVGTVDTKIVRPLIMMPFIAANSYIEQDTTLNIGNMCELVNVSQVCGALSWAVFTAGSTATTMSAFLRTVEG